MNSQAGFEFALRAVGQVREIILKKLFKETWVYGSRSIYINLTNEEKEKQLKMSTLYIIVLDLSAVLRAELL